MVEEHLIDLSNPEQNELKPTRRYFKNKREVWTFENGNIVEIVFIT